MDIQHFRRNYTFASLRSKDLGANPFIQFQHWFDEAVKASVVEPNAVALATVSKTGKPSCRMVLMKRFDASGFIFYTNLESRKAQEIKGFPFAVMTFFWKELERQVVIEGEVKEVLRQESETYFSARPRGSQLSAWASAQGQKIPSRDVLEKAYEAVENRYLNKPVPLPDFWGGFCLNPNRFEFWQGRQDRLHDRFQYMLENSKWKIDRLSP